LIGLVLLALLVMGGLHVWAWYHFRQANWLVERQQFSRAYVEYARSLRVWRWSAVTHLLAARAARRATRYADAERHLAECQRLQGPGASKSFDLALERLLLQAQSEEVSAVERPLWDYIDKNRAETPLILEALARGYVRMLRLGTALHCLQLLLKQEPDNIQALVLRGWILEGGGEPGPATTDYRHALELDPDRDDVRLSLAHLLLRDNPQEACSEFEVLIAHQPNNAEVLLGLGQAYRAVGETEKARPLIKALLAKDPENSKALAEWGALALASGGAVEAESLFRKAIAADPGNADAHYQLYLCLVQQPGREAEAAAQLETHKRVQADFARLGQIAGKEMTGAPNDPNLHYEMGIIYLRYGKPDQGVRWLYSALKLDPTHQPSHQALYEHFKEIGEKEKAEQHRSQLHARSNMP
jgi:tetratricopeptide (TPR) repeat protein